MPTSPTTERLFDVEPVPAGQPEPAISYTRRVTIRNQRLLDNGIHPVTRLPLRLDSGRRCGDCANHVTNTHARTYHKCKLNNTAGIATDIRLSWPSCTAYADHLEEPGQ